jgi:hypothetical protein
MKQFLFKSQDRLVRGRPILVDENKFMANLDEIKEKVKVGLIYVTLGNLTPFDVEKLEPVVSKPKSKSPKFPLDSINRDLPSGLPMNQHGDKPPPEHFVMPVPPPDAAIEEPLHAQYAEKPFSEEVSESVLPTFGTESKQSDYHRKKNRR